MSPDIPEICHSVLRKIFGDESKRYQVSVRGTGTKGEGYANHMIFLDIEKQGETLNLVLKIMPNVKEPDLQSIIGLYETEVCFYEKIWPVLDTFQRTRTVNLFDKIPRYFASASTEGRIVIAMENIKTSGFTLHRKQLFHDRKLVEFVFKELARFHAVSFALKEQDVSKFDKLRSTLKPSWNSVISSSFIQISLTRLTNLVASRICGDEEMKKRMQQIADRVLEEFNNMTVYKGKHGALTHGDCWINNFLFKYNESGDVEDVRFIDFQLAQIGTPVYDLSYFLYSGASKDILEDLEHFQSVYHRCLSSTLLEMGCDPERLYPYEVLKDEWKEYSKFAFFTSLTCWRGKTTEGVANILDADALRNAPNELKYDDDLYLKVITDLVRHMYHNGFL